MSYLKKDSFNLTVCNDTYLYKKKKSNIAIELLKYFSKLLNTKIELIDSDKHNIDYQNSKIKIELDIYFWRVLVVMIKLVIF